MNIRNYGVAIGRLVRDPQIFDNNDGSKKVLATIAVQDDFKKSDGTKGTQFVSVEAFISKDANGLGGWGLVHKGDLAGIQYTVKSNSYKDKKTGETVYTEVKQVEKLDLMEPKSVTDARQAKADEDTAETTDAPAEAPFEAE